MADPGGFSIASAGNRLGAGKAGLYRKSEAKPLFAPKDSEQPYMQLSKILTFEANVWCPSGRMRVAMGITGRSSFVGANDDVDLGDSSYWNIIPGVTVKGSANPGDPGNEVRDLSEEFFSRPLFWVVNPPGNNAAGQLLDLPAPYIDMSVDGSFIGGAIVPGGTRDSTPGIPIGYGRSLPDAYDAVSSINRFLIKGQLNDSDLPVPVRILGPIMLWASWEIIDPRNEEDSEALLNDCKLDVATQILPSSA